MERADIEQLAKLARIELSLSEQEALRADTEKILEFVGQIKDVNVSLDVLGRLGVPYNVLRQDSDSQEHGVHPEELLEAAPDSERGHVKVQKIL